MRNTNKYEVKIITKKGEEIFIDYEDFEKVKKYCWCISKTGYPVANINHKVTKLHRYILNLKDSKTIVDHINRNPLDNRKCNLRICSALENARNSSVSKNNKTGRLGISLTPQGKYRARIMVNRKEIRLGNYEKIEDAIEARKQAEKKYFKEFAPK
jgi:hypothetical protein